MNYASSALPNFRIQLAATLGGLPRTFWVLWWGGLINRMAHFVAIFLALYLRQHRGLNDAEAGWIVGLWGFGGTIAAPVAGVLTDRLGRRATMLLGLVLGAIAVVAVACTSNLPILVLLALAAGATHQLYFPSSNAAVADVVQPNDRRRAYGHMYWAMNMGLAIGFAVAGMVPSRFMFWLFLADAGTSLAAAALIAWKVPETRPAVVDHEPVLRGLARVTRDRVYMTFCILHTFALVIFTQFQLALPLDMADHHVSSQGFSWLMAFNCVGVVLLQPWVAPLLRHVDPSRLLAFSSILVGVGYCLNAFVFTLPLYLVGAALWTLGEVVGFPAASSLVADLAPVEMRGRYQGLFSMVWGLAMALSPVFGGQVMQRFGAPVLWYTCLVLSVFIAAGHVLSASSRRNRSAVSACTTGTSEY